VILTGLVLNKDGLELLRSAGHVGWFMVLGIPLFAFFILYSWLQWFRRHRELYNLRNETLHRLELQHGMYHFLRVVEADLGPENPVLEQARKRVHSPGSISFQPFYPVGRLSQPSGYGLVKRLTFGIPLFQFALLLAARCA
jgi:hypothetical protein